MSDDAIDRTVDHLLGLYRDALEQGNVNWRAARHGLTILLDQLSLSFPTHPAIYRLNEFLAFNDALNGAGSSNTH